MNKDTIIAEIKSIFLRWPIWFMLGTQDIKLRYRCSAIGPFWITINMAITIYCMSFLYGHLFKVSLVDYVPYLSAGIIGWTFLSTLIIDGSNAFIEAESYIKNHATFISLFMMRLFLRNVIIFLHNLLVFIPVIFIFHIGIGLKTFLLLPGLIFIAINMVLWGTLLAIITTRFRDFTQIVSSLMQIAFFLTPIMWMPRFLPENYQWIIQYNPFAQLLNLIREPLLNHTISHHNLFMVSVLTFSGFLLYLYSLKKYKDRVVFWL